MSLVRQGRIALDLSLVQQFHESIDIHTLRPSSGAIKEKQKKEEPNWFSLTFDELLQHFATKRGCSTVPVQPHTETNDPPICPPPEELQRTESFPVQLQTQAATVEQQNHSPQIVRQQQQQQQQIQQVSASPPIPTLAKKNAVQLAPKQHISPNKRATGKPQTREEFARSILQKHVLNWKIRAKRNSKRAKQLFAQIKDIEREILRCETDGDNRMLVALKKQRIAMAEECIRFLLYEPLRFEKKKQQKANGKQESTDAPPPVVAENVAPSAARVQSSAKSSAQSNKEPNVGTRRNSAADSRQEMKNLSEQKNVSARRSSRLLPKEEFMSAVANPDKPLSENTQEHPPIIPRIEVTQSTLLTRRSDELQDIDNNETTMLSRRVFDPTRQSSSLQAPVTATVQAVSAKTPIKDISDVQTPSTYRKASPDTYESPIQLAESLVNSPLLNQDEITHGSIISETDGTIEMEDSAEDDKDHAFLENSTGENNWADDDDENEHENLSSEETIHNENDSDVDEETLPEKSPRTELKPIALISSVQPQATTPQDKRSSPETNSKPIAFGKSSSTIRRENLQDLFDRDTVNFNRVKTTSFRVDSASMIPQFTFESLYDQRALLLSNYSIEVCLCS